MKKIVFILILILLAFPALAQENLDINLNWHCSTLVPENYQGRALPVRGSTITVNAIVAQENLIYDWYLDKNYMKYASGLDRQNFSFTATEWPGYSHDIRVKIYNQESELLGYALTSIKIQEPEIYLGGHEFNLSPGQSKSFKAIPYFFTTKNLDYKWFFNNQEVKGETSNPEIFNLSISPDSGPGTQKLDIIARNKNNLLERAERRVIINIK